MKKIFYFILITAMIIAACNPKTKIVPVDTEGAKVAVSALLDKYNSAFKAMDVKTMTTLLSDELLACGTDPSEFWNKKQIIDLWTQSASDTSLKISYTTDKREIRVSKDGNSAVVVEQFIFPFISPKISIRIIYNAVKEDNNWMINFISWNCIPRNEDIAKLNKVLE